MSAGPRPGRGRGCPNPWDGFGSLAALGAWPLLLLLSACAGTPWGERLSGSFPPAETPPPSPTQPRDAEAPEPPAPGLLPAPATGVSRPASPDPKSPVPPKAPPAAKVSPVPKAPPAPNPPPPLAPASPSPSAPFPYRVTLRLPRADPAAPAEAVTRALRAAGIPFEVDTIERMQGGAPAPSVRPAPPPR